MRILSLLFLSLAISMPALAQTDSYDQSGGAPALIPLAEEPAETAAPAHAAPAVKAKKEEVGYDANVKRDPNGKPIADEAATEAKAAPRGMRTDHNLRSDKELLQRK